MKIVFAVASYYPAKDGVQGVTQYHAEGLAAKGHKVMVVTSRRSGCVDKEIHNGVEIIRVEAFNKHLFHYGNKKEYRETILELTQDADALVAVCLQSYAADWLLSILDDIKIKLLYMHGMHDFRWTKKDILNPKDIIKKIARDLWWGIFYSTQLKNIRKFNAIIHLHKSDTAFKYFEKKKICNNYVIENAADNDFFLDTINPVEGLPIKYFISVANYDERKNQLMTMEAFYKAKTNDYGLIFIGSRKNKYFEKLIRNQKKLEREYGEKDVRLLTDIPRVDVCNYVRNSSVFFMSSKWEAFPISIIEAMASGKPYLSTDVGIVRLLPGGAIVNNKEDMVVWIETLINNEEVAELLGKSAKLYARNNLTKKVAVDKLEDLLNLLRCETKNGL